MLDLFKSDDDSFDWERGCYFVVLGIEAIAAGIGLAQVMDPRIGMALGLVGVIGLSFVPYVRWVVGIAGTAGAAWLGWTYFGWWGALPLGAVALGGNVAGFHRIEQMLKGEHRYERRRRRWWDWLD